MNCKEAITLMSDHLERVLPPLWEERLEGHLAGCRHCSLYLSQLQMTVRLAGKLRTSAIPSQTLERLRANVTQQLVQ